MAREAQPAAFPLLVWHEQSEIDRLAQERADLQRRINALRKHAHRRVELEARLRDLTRRQIALEMEIRRS